MLIHAKHKDLDATKEVKVKLPIRLYLRLHSVKVLTGKQISATIEEALEAHFRSGAHKPALLPDVQVGGE